MIALIVILVLLAAISGGAIWQEQRVSTAQKERDAAQDALSSAQSVAVSEKVTTKVVTQYVDRVQVVREVGATITREVPVYVTEKADAACPVPVGFVRLHDAAAEGRVPDPTAEDPDAPAEGVALSAVADTVSGNYTACHENAEQLIALQTWVNAHVPPEPAP
ncbi:hypothetical protein [Xanthomonas translucens]|uniref:hypothetical protein n=1 Tax=Xanthomonas campestris pv. translucens TaxID=343 RepID=UPI001F3D47E5|nr:hypothetical protein [Xanthomonas translucens]UII65660.1 hypothetical protein LV507_08290 [Xanthomonas translucens]